MGVGRMRGGMRVGGMGVSQQILTGHEDRNAQVTFAYNTWPDPRVSRMESRLNDPQLHSIPGVAGSDFSFLAFLRS